MNKNTFWMLYVMGIVLCVFLCFNFFFSTDNFLITFLICACLSLVSAVVWALILFVVGLFLEDMEDGKCSEEYAKAKRLQDLKSLNRGKNKCDGCTDCKCEDGGGCGCGLL